MVDKDPQDTDILDVIGSTGEAGIEPQQLIETLNIQYDMSSVIEALQRAIERGKISLNSEGMVISVIEYANAA